MAVLLVYSSTANAQLVAVFNEAVATGAVGTLPAGFTTYRIYARLQNPTDRMSAVFGSTTPSPVHHLYIRSSAAGSQIWNSSFGGAVGPDVNCAFIGFFPDLSRDSWVTIGAQDAPADPCPGCAGTQGQIFTISNPANMISGTFAAAPFGPDLLMVDGAWFLPNDGSCNGFPVGPDNRVLIAQVTVPTGTLEYALNISMFDEGVGANQLIYVHNLQSPPGFVGSFPEQDGTALGLVFPNISIPGCTDDEACNYDPAATQDDGSCTYPGCTDSAACNYSASAGCDNGSCTFPGCTSVDACNFNPTAGCDNGSCTFPGCTDSSANNYNPAAGCDDGSCTFDLKSVEYGKTVENGGGAII